MSICYLVLQRYLYGAWQPPEYSLWEKWATPYLWSKLSVAGLTQDAKEPLLRWWIEQRA